MNALEALKRIAETEEWLWARPVRWKGQAITLTKRKDYSPGGDWETVPDKRGGRYSMLPSPADLFGEWEVVEPRLVCEEVSDGR